MKVFYSYLSMLFGGGQGEDGGGMVENSIDPLLRENTLTVFSFKWKKI